MSKTENGGPAFPVTEANGANFGDCGMTLLCHFAGKAMQAIISTLPHLESVDPRDVADEAYAYADAMIAERNRRDGIEPAMLQPTDDAAEVLKAHVGNAIKRIFSTARIASEKGYLDQFARGHLDGQLAATLMFGATADAVKAASAELEAIAEKYDASKIGGAQ